MSSEIVWAKMKSYSAWPARICSAPDILQQVAHAANAVSVRFFGTHD